MRRQYGATGLMHHISISSDITVGGYVTRRAAGTLVATEPTGTCLPSPEGAEWGRGNEARSHSHKRTTGEVGT